MLAQAEKLIARLRDFSEKQLADLMNISYDLAELNVARHLQWQTPFALPNAKQALLAFRGEVFRGIDVDTFSQDDLQAAQKYLRILSGLYGVLRPLDLILPYRLEMGTKLETTEGKNLYEFWGNQITEHINKALAQEKHKLLVNLASDEYFKALKKKNIKARIIKPVFKENKNGTYKTIAVYAKKARGLMTRFIIRNRLTDAEHLKAFDSAGYSFSDELSGENQWAFVR